MKFLVRWKVKESAGLEGLKAFTQMNDEQESYMRGKVKLISRWHDLVGRTGVMICESDSEQELLAYGLRWSQYLAMEHCVVVNDEDARKIGKQLFAEAAVAV